MSFVRFTKKAMTRPSTAISAASIVTSRGQVWGIKLIYEKKQNLEKNV